MPKATTAALGALLLVLTACSNDSDPGSEAVDSADVQSSDTAQETDSGHAGGEDADAETAAHDGAESTDAASDHGGGHDDGAGSTEDAAAEDGAGAEADGDRAAAVAEIRAELPEESPETVVVMSVALAEIIDSLGVVPDGVPTSESPLPASLDDVPRMGSVISPDIERITELQPDLILGPASIGESLDKHLSATGLTTGYVPTDSLDDLTNTTLALGDLFGASEQAETLVAEVDQARSDAGEVGEVKVLILFGQAEEFNVLNEHTFAGGLVADLGATNVATELGLMEPYSPLSLEQVIVEDPDVILFLAHGDLEAAEDGMRQVTEDNEAWQKLRAVQDGRVHALDQSTFFSASLLNAPEAYREMADVLTQ